VRRSSPQPGIPLVLRPWARRRRARPFDFWKNRHGRFRDSDLLRRLFEAILRRCIDEGLVGGEGFAVDASLIRADANRQNGVEGEKGLASQATSRAINEYLAVLDDAAFGAATEVIPKFISPADPAARWTGMADRLSLPTPRTIRSTWRMRSLSTLSRLQRSGRQKFSLPSA
jgi:hypothetical protein